MNRLLNKIPQTIRNKTPQTPLAIILTTTLIYLTLLTTTLIYLTPPPN